MKKNSIRIITILGLCFIISCSKKIEQKSNFIISGNIKNLPDNTYVYLSGTAKGSEAIDSTYTSNNAFKLNFDHIENQGGLYNITFKREKEKFFLNVFLQEKSYQIKGDYSQKGKITVSNDEANNLLREYRNLPNKFNNKIDLLFSSKKSNLEKNNIFEKYFDTIKRQQKELLLAYPNNFFSMFEIFRFKTKLSKEEIKSYYQKLNNESKNNRYGKLLENYISNNTIKIGNPFIDFTAKDNFGKKMSLSDFNDKIIILDFWAYWCKWCHVQNEKEFSYLNEKYKDDIVIISYSLDEKIAVWEKSISKSSYKWVNLSNLKGISDPVAYSYQVNELPHTFIIDKQGIVQKEFIGYKKDSLIEKEIIKLINKIDNNE
tara:strand:+ start:286 stop:1407 length:1122 start_codon:yes stop_codon:yes gene_type:complete